MAVQKRMGFLLFLLVVVSSFLHGRSFASKKSYVVYLGGHSIPGGRPSAHSDELVRDDHYEFLGSFLNSKEKAKDAIVYSYTRHINGFAAILEQQVAMEISYHPRVISVFENRGYKLHTTHSWQFLGLERHGEILKHSLWRKARFGEDVIIGNLDTGVWSESESFRDEDMGLIPSRWKGVCHNESPRNFSCNRF